MEDPVRRWRACVSLRLRPRFGLVLSTVFGLRLFETLILFEVVLESGSEIEVEVGS